MSPALIVLKPNDAARVATLHAAAAQDPWPVQDYRILLSQSTSLGLGICAESTDALIAFLICQVTLDTADLLMIATDPQSRRKGFARHVLRRLLKRLGERGVERLTLDVAADNDGAIALYRAIGFAEDGRRSNYYRRETGRVDAVLMSRAITGLPPHEKA